MILKQGDRVDIIAPSSKPIQVGNIKKSLDILTEWGLQAHMPKGLVQAHGFHSNSQKARLGFVKQALSSPAKAVWSLRGGYGAQKICHALLGMAKPEKPRLFLGFSDATALHIYINQHLKWSSLHSCSFADLCLLSKKHQALLKSQLFGLQTHTEFKNLSCFLQARSKSITAPLLGGNLTIFQTSLGTNLLKPLPSCILFLEDVNEEPYKIDRALHQLLFAGILKNVRAIVFGTFKPVSQTRLSQQVLKSFSEFTKIPLITGLPAGHGVQQASLPLNTTAKLTFISSKKATLKIQGF